VNDGHTRSHKAQDIQSATRFNLKQYRSRSGFVIALRRVRVPPTSRRGAAAIFLPIAITSKVGFIARPVAKLQDAESRAPIDRINRRRSMQPCARRLLGGEHAESRSACSIPDFDRDDPFKPAGRGGARLERRHLPHAMRVVGTHQRGIHRDVFARWIFAGDHLGPVHTSREERTHRPDASPARTQPGLGRTQTGATAASGTAAEKAAAPIGAGGRRRDCNGATESIDLHYWKITIAFFSAIHVPHAIGMPTMAQNSMAGASIPPLPMPNEPPGVAVALAVLA
jgi:hypothetical protein